VKRLLLVRLSAMGDLVQSLAAIRSLHEARPDLELCMVTQRTFAPLLDGVLPWAAVVAHDRRGGLRAWLATRRQLRRLNCDVAVDLQGNWKSAAMARLSGSPLCIGAAGHGRQEPSSARLLHRLVDVGPTRHPAQVGLALLRHVVGDLLQPAAPRLAASDDEIAQAVSCVRRLGVDPTAPFRVVLGGDPADCRVQRPGALRRQLDLDHVPTILLYGPAEAEVRPPKDLPGHVHVMRQQAGELRGLVALGALLERVRGSVVGGDGGALHVLAATGVKTYALFGPQDPQATAPPAALVSRHPTPPACMPCRRRTCGHVEGPVCMDFTVS
jgi:heptosyltransferase-1